MDRSEIISRAYDTYSEGMLGEEVYIRMLGPALGGDEWPYVMLRPS
jgi:hypothetical protein